MKRGSESGEEDGELVEEAPAPKRSKPTPIVFAQPCAQDTDPAQARSQGQGRRSHDSGSRLAHAASDEDMHGVEGASRWDSGQGLDDAAEAAAGANKSRWLADSDDDSGGAGGTAGRWGGDEASDTAAGGAGEGGLSGNGDVGGVGAGAGGGLTPPAGALDAPPPLCAIEMLRYNMLKECRNKDSFDILKEVGVGTYGAVSKARDKETNEVYALKKILMPKTHASEGFPMTSVREINIMLGLHHKNIVNVTEVVTSVKNEVFMVMEFVQQDLKNFMDRYKSKLKVGEIKRIAWQLLQAMEYLHANWVLHRDLKPANILYDHLGNIKVCDFGLARQFGSPIHPMTDIVVTRYYRGPEIPMGVKTYGPPLDIWSVGVIVAELILGKAPFVASECEMDLAPAIARIIGSPHKVWKGFDKLPNYNKVNVPENLPSTLKQRLGVATDDRARLLIDSTLSETGYDLIERMMRWDPAERITASDALKHPWFEEVPKLREGCFMPQLPRV